jgi:hypothetical protein
MTRQGFEILLERHLDPYRLSTDERNAVRRGLAEMRQGTLASDEAVAAVFNRYR